MTNILKWPVWIRIAVVASIIWEGQVLYYYEGSLRDIWNLFMDYPGGYVPIFLFWSIAWIVHGIKLRKIQGHPHKEPANIQTPRRTSDPSDRSQDGQYVPYGNETVMDTKTNLMWAAKDNGSDINWPDAKLYCENYRGGGYADWRMPTHGELAGLYGNVHLLERTKLIQLSAPFLWGLETSGSGAANVCFASGTNLHWTLQSKSYRFRALPVRNAKKIDITVEDPARAAKRDAAIGRLKNDMVVYQLEAQKAGRSIQEHLKAEGWDDASITKFIALTKPVSEKQE